MCRRDFSLPLPSCCSLHQSFDSTEPRHISHGHRPKKRKQIGGWGTALLLHTDTNNSYFPIQCIKLIELALHFQCRSFLPRLRISSPIFHGLMFKHIIYHCYHHYSVPKTITVLFSGGRRVVQRFQWPNNDVCKEKNSSWFQIDLFPSFFFVRCWMDSQRHTSLKQATTRS